ncbi:N-6 DNA methylase [Atlantibacter hermannii]|uniref:N-6 DNA methylase n=1 Tax=Atlantibacter hermannii TaxID=565 RepID=UPI00289BFDF1|nr:N-6 DNA methylase [Atlantibacter hermannii]
MSQLSLDSLFDAFDNLPAVVNSTPAIQTAPPVKTVSRMVTYDITKKQFISVFKATGRHLRRWDVFSDFITLAASELDMARIRTQDNIERSRKICERYDGQDQENLKMLFCMLVAALEGKFQDFLGSIFMELELGSGDMGQYFTPYSVQSMMARLLIPGVAEIIREKGWFTLSEPTCGAAGMVIAYAECLLDAGFNPSEHMFVQCIDIDPIAADMAFIQLSLLGIAAEVTTGNTLTLQCSRVRYTPVYYLNEWEARLKLRRQVDAMKDFLASLAA